MSKLKRSEDDPFTPHDFFPSHETNSPFWEIVELAKTDYRIREMKILQKIGNQIRGKKKRSSPKKRPSNKLSGMSHSPDYCSVIKDGKEFLLTSNQAKVIQILWEASEAGPGTLGQRYISEKIDRCASKNRLRDIFKSNLEAWKALIEPGIKRGTFRLKK